MLSMVFSRGADVNKDLTSSDTMLNLCGIISFFTLFIRSMFLLIVYFEYAKVITFQQDILSNGSLLYQYLILLAEKTANETVNKTANDRENCQANFLFSFIKITNPASWEENWKSGQRVYFAKIGIFVKHFSKVTS